MLPCCLSASAPAAAHRFRRPSLSSNSDSSLLQLSIGCTHSLTQPFPIVMSRVQTRGSRRTSIKQTHSSKGGSISNDQRTRQLRSSAAIHLPAAAQKEKRPLTPQQLQQRQQAAAARAQQRAVIAQQRRAAAQQAAAVKKQARSASIHWASPFFSGVAEMRFRVLCVLHRLVSEAADAAAAPAHWESINPAHGNRHLLMLNPVKHANELAEVKRHWKKTQGVGSILSVHRIQNAALHRRYEEAKQQLQQSGKKHQADIIAYHGTSQKRPALIYDSPTGFDISKGMARPG